jgi:D-alanyl-D-alanine carboxypeptidase
MSTSLLYAIGSVTKTFTGTLFLQAYDEGLVNLDDPISKYFVGIPNGDNITVRQVGNMRSGLYDFIDAKVFNDALDENTFRVWSPCEPMSIGITNSPYFPPDTDFRYSSTNSIILGACIERLFNNDFATILQERMLQPLGLHNYHLHRRIQRMNLLPDTSMKMVIMYLQLVGIYLLIGLQAK